MNHASGRSMLHRLLKPQRQVLAMALALLLALGHLALAGVTAAAEPDCSNPPGFIRLDGRAVLEIRKAPAAQKLEDFVARGEATLRRMAEDHSLRPEQLVVWDDPPYAMLGIESSDGSRSSLMGVDDRAAACFGINRKVLAESYRKDLQIAIRRYRVRHSLGAWLEGTAMALLLLGLYVVWVVLQSRINLWLQRRIEQRQPFLLQRLSRLGLNRVVKDEQIRAGLQQLRQVCHWGLLALITYLLLPLLLAFFPPTMAIAQGLREQIRSLVMGALNGVVAAIPDLISIAVILTLTVLLIRLSNRWFRAVDRGQVQIPGFYQEWAQPTARIAAMLMALAGLAAAYPYIPGSGSKVFQGAGLFLGVLAALGSSSIATNVISGLMLIYTRAFREGDRVEINGVVGIVQERALLVTRVQTPRNELVSIPNATVIGSSVVNFSFSQREIQKPLALATTITIGYDVPWRQVYQLMLTAAQRVPTICTEPAPFVLQTGLNDFHISYELNAFVLDPSTYRTTLSQLHEALQDAFAAAGVEILSPGYHAVRNGNRSTVPPEQDAS